MLPSSNCKLCCDTLLLSPNSTARVPSTTCSSHLPITVPTRQFGDCALSTGFRTFISVDSNILTSTSLTIVSQNSTVQPALGPLGEVYYMAENGAFFKIYNRESRQISQGLQTSLQVQLYQPQEQSLLQPIYRQLYRLDSNGSVFQFYPVRLGQQVGGSPACITNGAFDYIVACYGNTIGAYQGACNASFSVVWYDTRSW